MLAEQMSKETLSIWCVDKRAITLSRSKILPATSITYPGRTSQGPAPGWAKGISRKSSVLMPVWCKRNLCCFLSFKSLTSLAIKLLKSAASAARGPAAAAHALAGSSTLAAAPLGPAAPPSAAAAGAWGGGADAVSPASPPPATAPAPDAIACCGASAACRPGVAAGAAVSAAAAGAAVGDAVAAGAVSGLATGTAAAVSTLAASPGGADGARGSFAKRSSRICVSGISWCYGHQLHLRHAIDTHAVAGK